MDYFPIFLDLKHKPCLVVGGGLVAERKVRLLLKAQACVQVVTLTLTDELSQLCKTKKITVAQRAFLAEDLSGQVLVIAATDDTAVNQQVFHVANEKKIWVNVADDIKHCQFIMPSIIDRGAVVVAASTSGHSPTLAHHLRQTLEQHIPEKIGVLAQWLGHHRPLVKRRIANEEKRRHFWDEFLQSSAAEAVLSGAPEKADRLLKQLLASFPRPMSGEVYMVGAGPGDPELLTLKALRLMQQADVVLYDRLVSEAILDKVRRDAERIYVGKRRDYHTVRQEEINQMIVRLAKQGRRVLRLKGGDPFIFGRGGEEIASLCDEAIPFQVVPGVTAASGCAAYAGIPLTHRDHAQSVTFVTGHMKNGQLDLNWEQLSQPRQTVVVYMGLDNMEELFTKLMQHGMSPQMPVALIEQGTSDQQRVITGEISTLPEKIIDMNVHAPTLIILGSVVRLHDSLLWRQ